jgi:hypothetical protein
MRRLITRIRCFFAAKWYRLRESDYDYLRLHLGTNSLALITVFAIVFLVAFRADVFDWRYLKGTSPKLAFMIGLFSVVFGMIFYRFWRLGQESLYSIHLAKTRFLPGDIVTLFRFRDFTLGIGKDLGLRVDELTSVTRRVLSIAIFLCLALITLDNTGYDKLEALPTAVAETDSTYCPAPEELEPPPPKEGCELIIRAYELGYADDLGVCEPDEAELAELKVCEKRRLGEPYLHFASRVVTRSVSDLSALFEEDSVDRVREKFEMQVRKIDELRDYQRYAMSAAPRASHHIWTNLPYPENALIREYRELLQPNYCVARFQNQPNTVELGRDDERQDSRLLEHVYGQLLFNPRGDLTVAYCKEFEIHWDSPADTCSRLAQNPVAVLDESDALEPVELVLKRHDIATTILELEAEMDGLDERARAALARQTGSEAAEPATTDELIADTVVADAQPLRDKSDLVSFQCLMQGEADSDTAEHEFSLDGTSFTARTRYVPRLTGRGEAQVAMYNGLAKLLEDSFHYSQYSSRSDMDIEGARTGLGPEAGTLENPKYLLSSLEILKNVDVFIDNDWVLERDDLLGVYPYHVHLQNYVDSFRAAYREDRGRL